MRAAFLRSADRIREIQPVDVMTRTEKDLPPEIHKAGREPERIDDTELAEIVKLQDRELMRKGLRDTGIKEETLQKLRSFDGLAVSASKFLACSLDLTHRMMIYQTVALFERAEHIKKHYLEDEALDHEIRVEWQKAYNEIAELIAKSYDRTLTGTQVLVNIMRGKKADEGSGVKRKPAFAVKAAPAIEANAGQG